MKFYKNVIRNVFTKIYFLYKILKNIFTDEKCKKVKGEWTMCNILISINPKYVESIFNGTKKYEYRKVKCKQDIDKIIIYSTHPIMKVVGEAKVEEILEDSPEKIWNITQKESGINFKFYSDYYENREKAIAYKLTDIIKYDFPKDLELYGVKFAPQSFVYVQ